MCNPFFVYAALTVATTAYSTVQARQNADAQEKYQKQVYATNAQIANEAALSAYSQLQRRQIQEQQAAAQGVAEVTTRAKEASGQARVAAGEAGVSGLSVDALLGDFHRQELDYQTTSIRNRTFQDAQFGEELKGIRNQQQGRILSALPQPVAKPDFFGAALRIGTDLVGGYNQFTSYDKESQQRVWNHNGQPASLFGP